MLYTKIQPWSFLVLEKILKWFLPYMVMSATLFNDAEPFEQIDNTFRQKDPCEIWWISVKLLQRNRRLKITRFNTST